MADETQQPDPNAAPPTTGKNKNDGAPVADPSVPAQKFRVLHAAVGGVATDKDGKKVASDYFAGSIVTADQLGGNEAYYLIMGAIATVDA